jgi:hypothetical protein
MLVFLLVPNRVLRLNINIFSGLEVLFGDGVAAPSYNPPLFASVRAGSNFSTKSN